VLGYHQGWKYLIVGIDLKNGIQSFSMSKIHLRVIFAQKSTKVHWYDYNNTIPLLNIAKVEYFIWYIILKISKFSQAILSASLLDQPASLFACHKT